jgi:hypothetical protein
MATATSSRLGLAIVAALVPTSAAAIAASGSGARKVDADPPEPDWQMRTRSNQRATFEAELLAAPAYPRYSELACEGDPR